MTGIGCLTAVSAIMEALLLLGRKVKIGQFLFKDLMHYHIVEKVLIIW